jgi:hypothetical protein
MTMRYAHLSPDVKRDAVRLLDLEHPLSQTLSPAGAGAREEVTTP